MIILKKSFTQEKYIMEEKSCELLGVGIAVGKREELLLRCRELLESGGAIATVNPEMLAEAAENLKLRAALKSSLCIPDGVGVRLALKARGIETDTLPGVELGEELLEMKPQRLGLIGAKAGVAEAALRYLCEKHPMTIGVFAHSGYGKRDGEYREIIGRYLPDTVFVCLGSPRQELFIKEMREHFGGVLFIGLGGSLDVYSGRKRRAPRLARKMGLEWAWRMLSEPKRLKRLPNLLKFLSLLFKERKKSGKIGKKGRYSL